MPVAKSACHNPLRHPAVNVGSQFLMSHSQNAFRRFQERAARRKAVAACYIAVMIVYLTWRLTIFNPLSPGLSLAYFTAEALGFVLGLVVIFCSWRYNHREPPQPAAGLSVDILVPTYQESTDIVRWTLIAAKEISYPHRTILLDDGNRPAMKALAAELGVDYFAREKNIDAKAGNLNFGLAHTNADFVMVLDADHVAMPHALDAMLGFFADERVAMVQTPQDFYNTDAFAYFNARNGGLWHDQTFFYNIAQPCRDSFNGASCCGTGVVYRRAALDAIGGIPTETVTEDLHTSLKMHKAGWRTVNLNEPVARGIAAANLREYYKTRHRWAYGNLHALRLEKILTCPGLTLSQRLSYLALGLIYLEGWQQLLLFTIPVLSLVTGWAPFEITVLNVLVVLFFPVLTILMLQELGCGLSRIWVNEIFAVARFPLHIAASIALFSRRKVRFRTSRKVVNGRIDWILLTPQIAVMTASLLALAVGIYALVLNFQVGPIASALLNIGSGDFSHINWNEPLTRGYTLELVAISGFWALFNASRIGVLIRKTISDRKRQANDYLFPVRQPLRLEGEEHFVSARVERLSRTKMVGQVYESASLAGQTLRARLYLPAGPAVCKAIVRSHDVRRGDFEADVIWTDSSQRDRTIRALLSVDWQREFLNARSYFRTPLEFLERLLTFRRLIPQREREWEAVLLQTEHLTGFAIASVAADRSAALVAFQAMEPGALVQSQFFTRHGTEYRAMRVQCELPMVSLSGQGLDGSLMRRYQVILLDDDFALDSPETLGIAAE